MQQAHTLAQEWVPVCVGVMGAFGTAAQCAAGVLGSPGGSMPGALPIGVFVANNSQQWNRPTTRSASVQAARKAGPLSSGVRLKTGRNPHHGPVTQFSCRRVLQGPPMPA